MAAKYQLKEGRTGKWRWNLLARNGRVIATSEPYETKRSALAGIESVRRNADAPLEDLSTPAPATGKASGSRGSNKAAPAAKKTTPAAKKSAPAAKKTAPAAKKTTPAAKKSATSGVNRRRTTPDTTPRSGTRRTSRAAARDLEAAAVPRSDVAAAAYSPEVQDVLEQALPGGSAPPGAAAADTALGLHPVEPARR
jgi:uncharacterized protein